MDTHQEKTAWGLAMEMSALPILKLCTLSLGIAEGTPLQEHPRFNDLKHRVAVIENHMRARQIKPIFFPKKAKPTWTEWVKETCISCYDFWEVANYNEWDLPAAYITTPEPATNSNNPPDNANQSIGEQIRARNAEMKKNNTYGRLKQLQKEFSVSLSTIKKHLYGKKAKKAAAT